MIVGDYEPYPVTGGGRRELIVGPHIGSRLSGGRTIVEETCFTGGSAMRVAVIM